MELDKNFTAKAFYYLSSGGLDEVELSLLFYFFAKGSDCFETSVVQLSELSFLLKRKEKVILDSLYNLQSKRVIKIKQSQKGKSFFRPSSLALKVNKECSGWDLDSVKASSQEKEVSKEKQTKSLYKMSLVKKKALYEDSENQAKLLVDFYSGVKGLSEEDKTNLLKDAKSLVGSYSFDASLFMLKHFYEKIDSFSELAKNWDNYQEELQKGLQKIDFVEAKKQHDKDDKEFKEVVRKWISLSKEKHLTEEETRVLEVLVDNSHPRRQLFWAYRFRENYPNLETFFAENMKRMLPVTTCGKVVKKKD